MNLEAHIREVPDFPKKGIRFKDITPLLQNPEAFTYCIQSMAAQWKPAEVDVIAGFDARGFIFGAPLAYELGKPFVPLRKAGKLPYTTVTQSYGLEYGKDTLAMHTDAVKPGQRVLLVDDLLATGGTAKAGCQLIEKQGAIVAGLQFVIELAALNGRAKIAGNETHSLLVYQ